MFSPRLLLFLIAGLLVASPPVRGQCSDCFRPEAAIDGALTRSVEEKPEPGPRRHAQAGDVTAVLIQAGETSPLQGRSQPGVTINVPTAFGAKWGQVYAGASYQHRIRYSDWHDGILAIGAGLGDPSRTVGLAVTLSVLDTYTDFGADRSLSLKLHRRLPYRSAVAVGYENIWHTAGTDGGASRYVVASTVFSLRQNPNAALGSVVLNVGLGGDRFLSEDRFARREAGANIFGGVALRIGPPVHAVANWSGQDLNLGLSIAPLRSVSLLLTPALLDVTGRAGDGARFAVSAALGVDVRR